MWDAKIQCFWSQSQDISTSAASVLTSPMMNAVHTITSLCPSFYPSSSCRTSSSSFPVCPSSCHLSSHLLCPLLNPSRPSFSRPLITSHFHVSLLTASFCLPAGLRASRGRIQVLGAELSLRGAPGLQDPGGVPRQEGRGEQTQPGSVSQLQRGPENQIPILQPTVLKRDEGYTSFLYSFLNLSFQSGYLFPTRPSFSFNFFVMAAQQEFHLMQRSGLFQVPLKVSSRDLWGSLRSKK